MDLLPLADPCALAAIQGTIKHSGHVHGAKHQDNQPWPARLRGDGPGQVPRGALEGRGPGGSDGLHGSNPCGQQALPADGVLVASGAEQGCDAAVEDVSGHQVGLDVARSRGAS